MTFTYDHHIFVQGVVAARQTQTTIACLGQVKAGFWDDPVYANYQTAIKGMSDYAGRVADGALSLIESCDRFFARSSQYVNEIVDGIEVTFRRWQSDVS